ncbi:hypothetical protein [Streptomyces sp. NPDC005322]|uniref:hypothetical protein n=1 Tax=Streptomyces sp. NPDC005322 TaxID=3157032 RepID=UPI0033A1CB73
MRVRSALVAGLGGAVLALGGAAVPAQALQQAPPSAQSVTCTVGVGHTAVWAKCRGNGRAVLEYWCKTTPWGSSWQHHVTSPQRINGSGTISRECAYEAADPYAYEV